MNATNQSVGQMRSIIASAEPGNKFKLELTNDTFDGELGRRLGLLLAMNGKAIQFAEVSLRDLEAVARQNSWRGIHAHNFTVLGPFNPTAFSAATIDQGLLVGIERVYEGSPPAYSRSQMSDSDCDWCPQGDRE